MRAKIMMLLIGMTTAAIVADYYGLLGVRVVQRGDYLHLTFEFVDAVSRARVDDVHVACTRPMVRSACTETRGPGPGQTTITFAVFHLSEHSWLFERGSRYSLGERGAMNLTFIPAAHARERLSIAGDAPLLGATKPYVVELTPIED